ncbi:MAG: hypothetical protein IT289_07790 [Oligoflexia bacterium]|nr:hypothetical protein [Oligoflexia bacterium]
MSSIVLAIIVCLVTIKVQADLARFTPEKKLGLFDRERYAEGCKFSGLPFETVQIDPRLKAKQKIVQKFYFKNGKADAHINSTDIQVSSVTTDKFNYVEKTFDVKNVPGLPEGFTTTKSCFIGKEGFDCLVKPAYPTHDASSGEFEGCSSGGGALPQMETWVGEYKLDSGKIIKAYRSSTIVTGNMICGTTDLGEVTTIIHEYYSNEIPSFGSPVFCGGSYIANEMINRNSKGVDFIVATGELIDYKP